MKATGMIKALGKLTLKKVIKLNKDSLTEFAKHRIVKPLSKLTATETEMDRRVVAVLRK